jgi:hypothetical protein
MCLGFVRNFAGFVAVRAILGVAEGGLLPGMVYEAYPGSFSLIPAGCVPMSETKASVRYSTCLSSINVRTWPFASAYSTPRHHYRGLLEVKA